MSADAAALPLRRTSHSRDARDQNFKTVGGERMRPRGREMQIYLSVEERRREGEEGDERKEQANKGGAKAPGPGQIDNSVGVLMFIVSS